MDVIGHQAVTQNLQSTLSGFLPQQIQILLTVPIGQKHVLPIVAALSHVMEHSGDYDTCDPGHESILAVTPTTVKKIVTVPN